MKYSGFLREHSQLLMLFMRVLDWLVLLAAFWGAMYLTVGIKPSYNLAVILATLLSLSVYPVFSIYRAWRGATFTEELRSIFIAWSVIFILVAVISVLTKTSANYSRLWFGHWYLLGLLGLFISRLAIRWFLSVIRSKGLNKRRIVVIGTSDLGQMVINNIKAAPWYGFEVVGCFSESDSMDPNDDDFDFPVLGGISDVKSYFSENHVDQVWIALSMESSPLIRQLLNQLDATTVDIRLVPDVFSLSLLTNSVSEVAGMPVLNVSLSPMEGINRLVKALQDRLLALFILLLISPVMLVLASFVKLTSHGPVFYRQERVSWNGDTFGMLKFRSMPVDTEKDGVKWGGAKDKAIHPFGQFIRKTSLDELPQFINVLLGDMSIVGPRPERTVFVEKFKHEIPGYMKKHKVKAGITGWAQINGWRGDTDLHKRVECDLYYIKNWSLFLDIKIIFLTVFKGFFDKNAY